MNGGAPDRFTTLVPNMVHIFLVHMVHMVHMVQTGGAK